MNENRIKEFRERQEDITLVFRANPDLKIKKIYDMASRKWQQTIKNVICKQYPNSTQNQIRQAVAEELPGYDTVRNFYNNVLKPNAEKLKHSPLDEPWSLGTHAKHNLPRESISIILAVQEWGRLHKARLLTIREAQWVSNLSAHIKSTKVLPIEKVLFFWAILYSIKEHCFELTGGLRDTSLLDAIAGNYAEEYVAYPNLWWKAAYTEEVENHMTERESFEKSAKMVRMLLNLKNEEVKRELTREEKGILDSVKQIEEEDNELLAIITSAKLVFPGTTDDRSFVIAKVNEYFAEKEMKEKEAQNERTRSTERQP